MAHGEMLFFCSNADEEKGACQFVLPALLGYHFFLTFQWNLIVNFPI